MMGMRYMKYQCSLLRSFAVPIKGEWYLEQKQEGNAKAEPSGTTKITAPNVKLNFHTGERHPLDKQKSLHRIHVD